MAAPRWPIATSTSAADDPPPGDRIARVGAGQATGQPAGGSSTAARKQPSARGGSHTATNESDLLLATAMLSASRSAKPQGLSQSRTRSQPQRGHGHWHSQRLCSCDPSGRSAQEPRKLPSRAGRAKRVAALRLHCGRSTRDSRRTCRRTPNDGLTCARRTAVDNARRTRIDPSVQATTVPATNAPAMTAQAAYAPAMTAQAMTVQATNDLTDERHQRPTALISEGHGVNGERHDPANPRSGKPSAAER